MQAPEEHLTTDQFDEISKYIIAHKKLCYRLITVTAFGYKVMGYPIRLEHR